MANNSAKKNQQSIKTIVIVLNFAVYGLIGWVMVFNSFYLISETISIWHWILCLLVSAVSYFCLKQIIKCWQLQLPSEAAEYYYDILALNLFVQLIDPFTHFVWHLYWLILVFVAWQGLKWLWDYITPKYDPVEQQQSEADGKKRQKKQKKQKVKYAKH